ncbi:hypothetical protein EDB83DRAFT_1838302 [Lactarius deliciosus]|nr:hypothetical protein EDB83DRAFT_1838302 [Lactarius deliciosus]
MSSPSQFRYPLVLRRGFPIVLTLTFTWFRHSCRLQAVGGSRTLLLGLLTHLHAAPSPLTVTLLKLGLRTPRNIDAPAFLIAARTQCLLHFPFSAHWQSLPTFFTLLHRSCIHSVTEFTYAYNGSPTYLLARDHHGN